MYTLVQGVLFVVVSAVLGIVLGTALDRRNRKRCPIDRQTCLGCRYRGYCRWEW
jgi:hypothetical protein